MTTRLRFCAVAGLVLMSASASASASHDDWWTWSVATPVVEVNSPMSDGCPIESRDGLSWYIASTRIPGVGNDIFAADRAGKDEQFGEPRHLDAPVNTTANDFCPTPIYGSYLLFVSERPGPETCNAGPGSGDMYIVRRNAASGWGRPSASRVCGNRHRAEQRRRRIQPIAGDDGGRHLSLTF